MTALLVFRKKEGDMMTIIQGSNSPIRLKFAEETDFTVIKELSCVLKRVSGETLKKYSLKDVLIDEVKKIMFFPLTQQETLKFPNERINFFCKLYDEENNVIFLKKKSIFVSIWDDDTIFDSIKEEL